ncbi:GntR family transcriptional regulator [Piscinibacter sakaiensis]|uniref:Transcriptional regulator, GntR family n=1 Tax=Piscinibacter sakaiensis TaxID=1547922 RepID=A0A0K8P5W9_PISS1|nr:GntR family transcriptional regulator [Piscinibacter sakaiensis]GAP37919.1 transcriptional regulator, GntR family [Piscinibacter sakaiensis]
MPTAKVPAATLVSRPSQDTRATPAAAATFQAVRSTRAFEEIASQIRNELAEGRLKVGSRLPSERALAEQFGVSRNTLREALRSLEHAGLIRLLKGASGGAFISERSGDAIVTGLFDLYHVGTIRPEQVTEARIWLESIIVREACTRATVEDLAALNRNIDEAEEAAARGDFPLRASKHIDFHRILVRITHNPIMIIVMDGVLDVLHHFVRTIGEYQNAFVLPSRRRFMKHMEEGDVEAAVAEMESSLKRLQRAYLSKVEVKQEPVPLPGPAPVPAAAPVARPARKTRPKA